MLVLPSTYLSIELQATTPVPEWSGHGVRSPEEEDVVVGEDGKVGRILARQTRYPR